MITLTFAATTLELSDRLIWTDEFDWTPVVSAVRWGTTGAMQVHVGTRQAGRPITLDGRESEAWISRALCDQLNVWHAVAGAVFTLVIRGQSRSVMFDQSQGAGFTAAPVWKLLDGEHTGETLYRPFFKFLET